MVFLILGMLQLTLAQQARLQLEYAAFAAARSGAVWNMDRRRMARAALTTLLPTLARVDEPSRLRRELQELDRVQATLAPLGIPARVKLTVLRPTVGDFEGAEELDFDASENLDKARLTLHLVYSYELAIPFANALLWDAWYALRLARNLPAWRVGQPAFAGTEAPSSDPQRCAPDRLGREGLAALARAASRGRYFLPLVATYTIRMQSNPFVRDPRDPTSQWAGEDDGC